jgi:hypothetical protein
LFAAAGIARPQARSPLIVGLYAGIVAPTLAAPGTLIAVSTARAVGTTTAPWWVEAELLFDSVSGKLQGVQSAIVNNLYDAKAALAAVVAGINGAVGSAEPDDLLRTRHHVQQRQRGQHRQPVRLRTRRLKSGPLRVGGAENLP